MMDRGCSWILRRDMECEVCAKERQRRKCVKTDANDTAYMEEPFAHAPFVHPFNAPKHHAQQLRAVNFGKANNRQVLWVIAHDKVLVKGDDRGALAIEHRVDRFLELPERETAGMMGMLPLVKDMPMVFTNSENRSQGVFKHSRGKLVGWILPDEERERIRNIEDPEIVLQQRPTKLLIEVATATAEMPDKYGKGVYALALQHRAWTVDSEHHVKVLRSGFPIVPAFGGTAHAFCGTSLDVCMGDLLPWSGHLSTKLEWLHNEVVYLHEWYLFFALQHWLELHHSSFSQPRFLPV